MQISGIVNRLSDYVASGRRESNDLLSATATTPAAGSTAPGREALEAMRDILGQYDVAEITPREFSEMLQKLRQSGAISDADYQELSQVRMDLDREGTNADEPVNLLSLMIEKLKDIQEKSQAINETAGAAPGGNPAEALLKRQVEWLEKFAAVHENPMAIGLDAQA